MIGHVRRSLGVALGFMLLAPFVGGAAAQTAQEALGISVDPSQAIQSGWLASTRVADFPLEEEAKIRTVLAGLVAPNSGARIFILYSTPKGSLPLSSIGREPAPELLDFLGVDARGASGRYENDFLAPEIDAIHWFIRGPGDGITFRPSGSIRRQETYGIRTILSFGVVGPNGKGRRLLLSAFLRCKARDAEKFTPVFWDFLKTIRPIQTGARLVPESQLPTGHELEAQDDVARGTVMEDFNTLIGRHLASLSRAGRVSLAPTEEEALDHYLRVFPTDILAIRLRAASDRHPRPSVLSDSERVGFVEHLVKLLTRLGNTSGFEAEVRQYRRQLKEVAPDHPQLAVATPRCSPGSVWLDEAENRQFRCGQVKVSIAGTPTAGFAALPVRPRHGEVVDLKDEVYSWHEDLGSWLPTSTEPGETVLSESAGPLTRLAGRDGLVMWARLEVVRFDQLRSLRRSTLKNVCPSSFTLLSSDTVDWDHPSSEGLVLTLLRSGTKGFLYQQGQTFAVSDLAMPRKVESLSEVRLRDWKGEVLTGLCAAALRN